MRHKHGYYTVSCCHLFSLSSALQGLNQQGLSVFDQENNNTLLKSLVLVADTWRPTVNYTTLNKNGDAQAFMQAYASDAWLVYKRQTTTQPGQK